MNDFTTHLKILLQSRIIIKRVSFGGKSFMIHSCDFDCNFILICGKNNKTGVRPHMVNIAPEL